jgi:hypothetical protein
MFYERQREIDDFRLARGVCAHLYGPALAANSVQSDAKGIPFEALQSILQGGLVPRLDTVHVIYGDMIAYWVNGIIAGTIIVEII